MKPDYAPHAGQLPAPSETLPVLDQRHAGCVELPAKLAGPDVRAIQAISSTIRVKPGCAFFCGTSSTLRVLWRRTQKNQTTPNSSMEDLVNGLLRVD